MGVPWLTWSPTLTRTSETVPAVGAGISIVALSDSRVMTGSSSASMSPACTWISTTGTSVKSPMSGTVISMVPVPVVVVMASPYTTAGLGLSGSIP